MERKCLHCGEQVSGRSDKKFCSDYCRSLYNYAPRKDEFNFVKQVNYILRKNWNILRELSPEGKARTSRSKLVNKGFNFSYHTNTYTNKNGLTYYYIYDKGYLFLENDYVAILEKPDYIE